MPCNAKHVRKSSRQYAAGSSQRPISYLLKKKKIIKNRLNRLVVPGLCTVDRRPYSAPHHKVLEFPSAHFIPYESYVNYERRRATAVTPSNIDDIILSHE